MGRPRTPIGTLGDISYAKTASGQIRARTRFRDDDGQIRRVSATGPTRKAAERNLKEVLSQRTSRAAYAELTPDSSFKQLVELWLEDLDLEGKLAPSTRALYERNIRQLVTPVFEHYALREITVASTLTRFGRAWRRRNHSSAIRFGRAPACRPRAREDARLTVRSRTPPAPRRRQFDLGKPRRRRVRQQGAQ
jgi:Phage integrase, N-terminal SAM-like domain